MKSRNPRVSCKLICKFYFSDPVLCFNELQTVIIISEEKSNDVIAFDLAGVKLSDSKSLSGAGRLTQARIDAMQLFYGRALREKQRQPSCNVTRHISHPETLFRHC